MKRLNIITLLLLLFLLVGCQENNIDDIQNQPNGEFPIEFASYVGNRPVYITSIGQSVDVETFVSLLDNTNNTDYVQENILDVNLIKYNAVVFVLAGSSVKGLYQAGTTVDDEIKRVKQLNAVKKANDISIIVLHLGGNDRRGTTSDLIIKETFKISDLAIYLENGNEDGFLYSLVDKYDIPHIQYSSLGGLRQALDKLYK